MEKFVVNILRANILAALFIILVLSIGVIVKKHYSSKWKYLMWLVVSIFLLFPIPMFSDYAPIQIDIPQKITRNVAETDVAETLQEEEFQTEVDNSYQFMKFWLTGIVIIGFYRVLSYMISRKTLMRWSVPQEDEYIGYLYRQVCQKEKIGKAPMLMRNTKLQSPVLVGLKKACLYLPDESYSEEEFNLIFQHELTHYKKKDLWYKTFLVVVNTIYWFNPFLYLVRYEAQKDIEYLCDCTVVENRSKEDCILYSRLLIKTASEKSYIGYSSASLNDGTATLKERIVYIMKKNRRKYGMVPAILCVAVLMAANILIGCSVTNTKTPDSSKVESENKNQILNTKKAEEEYEKELVAIKRKKAELQKDVEIMGKETAVLESEDAEEQKRMVDAMQREIEELEKLEKEMEEVKAKLE